MKTSFLTGVVPFFSRVFAVIVLLGGTGLLSNTVAQDSVHSEGGASIVVDDFEKTAPGAFPDGWVFVRSKDEFASYEETRDEGETVEVRTSDGNRFVRLITEGEALRYSKVNGKDFNWNVNTHPYITWRWRALKLPDGASERDKNDTGGALYVTFGTDWLGRPKSIKYTYSSSLPIGSVVSFGALKVIVVGSAREPGTGTWKTVQRNVVQDYRQVFGGKPPKRPVSITIWSDSDTTGDTAQVDFDDIALLPASN